VTALFTYALELLASVDANVHASDGSSAVDVLLRASRDPSAIIREGAVLGMAGHRGDTRVIARLREMVSDESQAVAKLATGELT